MKPKEILIKAINDHLLYKLSQEGFVFSDSQLSFKRKLKNGFIQNIHFRGSRNNMVNHIADFQPQYFVFSSQYKKWAQVNFPGISFLGGGNIPADYSELLKLNKKLESGFGYDFLRTDNAVIMNDMWLNYQNVVKSFFDANDSWEKMAENPKVQSLGRLDGFILSGQMESADRQAQQIYDFFITKYGTEADVPLNAKHVMEILKSRIKYIQDKLVIEP